MATKRGQLTERQRALLDALATINSYGLVPSLHYWTRDYNDRNGSFDDGLALASDITGLIGNGYVAPQGNGGYPQYLITPQGWDCVETITDPTMADLWHKYLSHPSHNVVVGA